jgi:hypothetical protein
MQMMPKKVPAIAQSAEVDDSLEGRTTAAREIAGIIAFLREPQ